MPLAHTVVGNGKKEVVLLHGFLGSGRNLRTVAVRLVEADSDKRVVLVDLPAHGESRPAREDETLQSMARDVAELINGPAHWIGHSLGGRVALAGMEVAPAKVSTVTMLDISPSPIPSLTSESGGVLEMLRRAPERASSRQELRDNLLSNGISPPIAEWLLTNVISDGASGFKWRFDREALKRLHERVNPQDLWSIVERRERPLLAVRGKRSKYVSDEDASRLELFGAVVKSVDAGHFVHVDALDQLMPELIDWTR